MTIMCYNYLIQREALELAVDSLQKESFTLKSEKEDALRKCAAIESRFSHIQA